MYYGKVLGKPKIERPAGLPFLPRPLPLAEMSQRIGGGGGWRNGGEGPPKLFSIQWDKRAKELCLLFFFFVFSATVKGAYQHFALRYLLIILLRFLFFFAKFAEARTNTLFSHLSRLRLTLIAPPLPTERARKHIGEKQVSWDKMVGWDFSA